MQSAMFAAGNSGVGALGAIGFLFALAIGLAVYFFFCFCMKKICEKAGHEPGVLIWIPIANLVPMLTVAKMPVWMIVLFFIPLVNIVIAIMMWWKICEARGKSGALGLLMLVPLVNLGLLLYLAFGD